MALTRLLLLLALGAQMVWAETILAKPVPSEAGCFLLDREAGQAWFEIPKTPYSLVTNTLEGYRSRVSLLRRQGKGPYQLVAQQVVDGEWDERDAYSLSYFALGKNQMALATYGSCCRVLVYGPDLAKPARTFDFQAPAEASPWAVPEYHLAMRKGKLLVELGFSTPEGPSSQTVVDYVWNGRDFVRPEK